MGSDDELLIAHRGPLVTVTLNRPHTLNALSLDMCVRIDRGLRAWQADPEVCAVLVQGAGERAFCAGGDIRALYRTLTTEGIEQAVFFYSIEYPMNARLHHFTKPWISLWDGIVMGGGVGVSAHGSHRVVTERTVFAMPETGIGLFPDVGATYLLPRLPSAIGMYLGLTGARLGPADCLYAGLASTFVPGDRLGELAVALAGAELSGDPFAAVDRVLKTFETSPGGAELPGLREPIDACFGQPNLEAVLRALEREPSGWGRAQLELLRGKSPTSLAVTFRQIQNGAGLGFDAAMRLEYRLVHRFMAGHDFREGVRAAVIDKDNRPSWRPARLEDVSTADIDGYFAPLPGGELALDDPA
jgi:enoyl-CoA hydratase